MKKTGMNLLRLVALFSSLSVSTSFADNLSPLPTSEAAATAAVPAAASGAAAPAAMPVGKGTFAVPPLSKRSIGPLGQVIETQEAAKALPVLKGPETVEPSAIERAMGTPGMGALTQFGYSFFKPDAAVYAPKTIRTETAGKGQPLGKPETVGFEPMPDVPVGPDYLLGPGDTIVLSVWGSLDGTFELEVNRSGEIVLPKVGTVRVAGASFGQLPALLKGTISRVYKDFHLNGSMGKLKLIKVYVVGEVTTPGDYIVSSMSTLINAISAAGGPTKNGSLRSIQINRNGRIIESVDLYDFFLKGDKGKDVRLQSGDTVLVPVIGPVAGIAGNVRRPAIYELKGEKSMKELLSLAAGIKPTGYLQWVQLYRLQAHDKKMVTDFNLDPSNGKSLDEITGNIAIQDQDLVRVLGIDNVLRGSVHLEGHVVRPGDYALTPGMRISTLLNEGKPLSDYYTVAGQLTRLVAPDSHQEVIFFDVSRALAGDKANDLELKEFDKIKIFAKREMEEGFSVKVSGEVQIPGQFPFSRNLTVRDLLLQAGNLKVSAYTKEAEITRIKRTGESVSYYSVLVNLAAAMRGDAVANIKLEPFDELNVRRIPNWVDDVDRYVTLKGEFMFPGVYPIYRGERLSSVIRRAGGFTDKAFLSGAKFTRVQVRELQQKRMDEILAKTEMDLNKKESEMAAKALSPETQDASKVALEGLRRTVDYLKQKKAEGRLVIKVSSPDQMAGNEYDLEAQGGDLIEVPSDPKMVSVYGQVYNPSSFVYLPEHSIKSYLRKSGGPTNDAAEEEIYLIKADGSVESMASNEHLFYNGFMSKQIESGDTLVVPQRIEKVIWLRDLKDIAAILGNLAITAGVIVAAGL